MKMTVFCSKADTDSRITFSFRERKSSAVSFLKFRCMTKFSSEQSG